MTNHIKRALLSFARLLIAVACLLPLGSSAFADDPTFCAAPSPPPEPPVQPIDGFCGGPGGGGGSGGPGGGGAGGPGSTGAQPEASSSNTGQSGLPASQPPCPPNECSGSPCMVASGNYTTQASDLQITTIGFPLLVSRQYESARVVDGILGIGWTSNLAARLHYAAYLYAAPDTYSKEAHIVMPDGSRYVFTQGTDGTFSAPAYRHDTLMHHADGTWTLTVNTSSRYLFSPTGRLISLTDEFGNALEYTYDPNDRLTRVADSAGSGRYLDIYYGANGRISHVQDHSGRQVAYTYNSAGSLTVATDALGRDVTYAHTNVRFGPLLTKITDSWGRAVTEVTYDNLGRTLTYTERGEKYTYVYGYNGRADQSSKTDQAGNRWVYTFTPHGVVTDRSYPGSAQATKVFAADGAIQQLTDEVGVKTLYAYAGGRVVSVTHDHGGSLAVRFDYTYDSSSPDKMTSVTARNPNTNGLDPNWQSWRYEYYQPGSAAPGALHRVKRVHTDGVTLDTLATYTYNTHGQLVTSTDALGAVTERAYDAAGNLASITMPANNDAAIRPIVQYAYDTLGRATSITDPLGKVREYEHDAAGRIIARRLPAPSAGSTVFTTTYAYDQLDASFPTLLFKHTTDQNGRVTKHGHDVFGQLVRSVDAAGESTGYTYARALLESTTDANGNTTGFGYDALGRITSITFPGGARETLSYWPDGFLASRTDRRQQTTTYSFDALKRLSRRTYPNSAYQAGTYAGQQLAQVLDTTVTPNETHTYTYDAAHRVATVSQGSRGTITYTYDATDRLAGYTLAGGGPSATYTRFSDGSLRTIDWSAVTGSFGYTYRLDGQYSAITFPNGQVRSYSYDDQARLTQADTTHPVAGALAGIMYGYDGGQHLGQRTSASVGGSQMTYGFDALYQLTSATYPGNDLHTWTYDGLGNRLTSTASGVTNSYTYHHIGANPENSQRLASDGTQTYTHDANGNKTAVGTNAFSWDYENRLTSVTGAVNATYRYDYQGRRSAKTVAGVTTNYLYDGLNLIRDSDTDYLFGPKIDEPLAMVRAGVVAYYVVDGLGSVTSVVDSSGTAQVSYSYDAWGKTLATSGALLQPFRYTAREAGELPQHYFYRARYYSSDTGQFLSEDPWKMAYRSQMARKGRSPWREGDYGYAAQSPVLLRDPLGLAANPGCVGAWSLLGAGIGFMAGANAGGAVGGSVSFGTMVIPSAAVGGALLGAAGAAAGYNLGQAICPPTTVCAAPAGPRPLSERCTEVKEVCIADCIDFGGPFDLGGNPFYRCVNECMAASGCPEAQ